MAEFSVSTQSLSPSSALCKLAGEADAVGFDVLEEEFGKLHGAGVRSLILELSGLENLTGAMLGLIIHFGRVLEEEGGKLVLTLLRPANEGLLEMLNLRDSLVIADSLDAARRMLGGTGVR